MNNVKNAPRVEGSTEKITEKLPVRTFSLIGLEDVPRSIIPVPYYKFVHPQTEKAFLPDGTRAENGSFLMPDIREAVTELRIVVLRAKRATRVQQQEDGTIEKVVSLQILGINLERQRPFILSVPVTSFGAFGAIFEEMELKKFAAPWDYPVYITSSEVKKPKETSRGMENVTYWVVEASLEPKALDEKSKEIAAEMYQDFAAKLDREESEDDLIEMAGKTFTK
jgi:hypothetical protein